MHIAQGRSFGVNLLLDIGVSAKYGVRIIFSAMFLTSKILCLLLSGVPVHPGEHI